MPRTGDGYAPGRERHWTTWSTACRPLRGSVAARDRAAHGGALPDRSRPRQCDERRLTDRRRHRPGSRRCRRHWVAALSPHPLPNFSCSC